MLQAGQKFGHFEITRKLGEGGMGEVYLAQDTKLNRRVALKILSPEFFDNPERQERFQREAKTVASISHPSVMGIYDINSAVLPGTDRRINFIVMEYVEGESLSSYLLKVRPDMASMIRMSEKIASGLAAAHKVNVVHRDIKADNIVINEEGDPKILDFGLAKPVEPLFEGDTDDITKSVDKQELTRAGKILGTVSYMSPEQSRGEKVDTRSDIFSFGVLLYRMATGEFPFAGPTSVSTLAKILETKQESPRLKNENIPQELERIIEKCLQKDPNDRYQDTRDLVVDLRNLRRLYDSAAPETISSEYAAQGVKDVSRFRPGWKSIVALFFAIAVVLIAVLEYLDTSGSARTQGVQAKTNSLAIIGFENKTGDAELDWLETGLPEILLTDLAQAEAITIISRERIIDCFSDDKKASHTFDECAEAAAGLGAVNLLSGAFYKLGDKIRIDARLQDVATGNIIFGEKVVGDDPFTLVDSLTEKIAASLNIGYTEPNRNVALYTSSSPEAFKHYHLGVDKMYLGLYDDAISEFNQALAIDSTFALAYMRKGMSYVFDGREQEGARYFQKATEYRHKLPERDQSLLEVHSDLWLDQEYDNAFIKMASFVSRYPEDKEAHAMFALLVSVFTGDTVKAYAHLDTALRIDPTYALALEQYVSLSQKYKQYDRAIEYARLMKKYHPESPEPALALARIYVVLNRLDDAVAEVNELLDRFPRYQNGLYLLSNLFIAKRDFESCLEVLERLKAVDPNDSRWMWSYYHQQSDIHGWRGQFRESIADLKNAFQVASRAGDSTRVYRALSLLAGDYHRVGEPDSAFYYLKKSYEASDAFTMADYPLTAVAWDYKKAEELKPIMDTALAEFQKKVPSELWGLVNNVRDLFYAFGAADTSRLIEILEAQRDLQRQVNSSEQGRTLGRLQILTGDYEGGKANMQMSLGEFSTIVSSDQYVSSHYYLGLAEEGLGNTDAAIRHYEEVLEYWGKADVQTDVIKDTKKRLAALTG